MRRLRILCLHGFRSSGAGLQAQMRPLVQGLEELVELVYVDAPALAAGGFAWWNAQPFEPALSDAELRPLADAKHYQGWLHARASLLRLFAEQPPFDGVFGFSQGAALAALLVGQRARRGEATSDRPFQFEFVTLVSGFTSNDPRHAASYGSSSFALPALHLIGRADAIVPPAASYALANRFSLAEIIEHEAGHVIASTVAVRAALAGFWERQSAAKGGVQS